MSDSVLGPTEQRNARSAHLDKLSSNEFVALMHGEDVRAIQAVGAASEAIAGVIDLAQDTLSTGGRIIYIGAGTSGRLGVLDASECPPTFSSEPHQVMAIIAGGESALRNAVEGAEDNTEQGALDLKGINLLPIDFVIGIAASGNTPYVIGALEYANANGCRTASISNNPAGQINAIATSNIVLNTGAEVLTGSTRLKAGTAQKLTLNMISTGAMIGIGKAYENLMVDVAPSNNKLRNRCERIVMAATNANQQHATSALITCDYRPKPAILMLKSGLNLDDALALLDRFDGHLGKAIEATIDTPNG